MRREKILLVMNPRSGKGRALKDKPAVERILKSRHKLITYITRGENDVENIRELKTSLPKIHTVVVCGGDGTLNMTLNALHSFQDVRYIFLPYGTINIFARENGYPKSNAKALLRILDHGQERELFPGLTPNKAFLLMTSLGFDSHLVYKVESGRKKLMALSYLIAFIWYALRYNFKKTFQVTIDDQITDQGTFILISSCKKYGGFFYFTPEASYFKKDFDIFIFRGTHFFHLMHLMLNVLLFKRIPEKKTRSYKGRKVLLQGEGFTQTDGEIGDSLPVTIKKEEKGVTFVLPKILH